LADSNLEGIKPRLRVGNGEIVQVYAAYVSGCRTTPEVSALTGISVKRCSAHTWRLIERGRLKCTGLAPVEKNGGKPRFYEPI
jgi:hypothetical protein